MGLGPERDATIPSVGGDLRIWQRGEPGFEEACCATVANARRPAPVSDTEPPVTKASVLVPVAGGRAFVLRSIGCVMAMEPGSIYSGAATKS